MRGYPLKAKQEHFPKHIKKSYANGLWQRSCGCIVVHTGPSWQDLLFALIFNLRTSSPSYAILSRRWDTGWCVCVCVCVSAGRANTAANAGSNSGCACLFVPTTKSHARPRLWKCSCVPDPCAQPAIPPRPTTPLCVFTLQTLTSHQKPSCLVRTRQRNSKAERKESAKLAKMWFPLAQAGQEFRPGLQVRPPRRLPTHGPSWVNTQCSHFSTWIFQNHHSVRFIKWKPLSCLLNNVPKSWTQPFRTRSSHSQFDWWPSQINRT